MFVAVEWCGSGGDVVVIWWALVVGDRDVVRLSGRLVRHRDVQNTVCIHIKRDFDLRDTTWCRRDTRELILSEQIVVHGASALSFVHLNKHTRLVVRVRRKDFVFFCGNCGVTLDESGHDTVSSLDTEGKRGNVKKKISSLLRGVAGENGGFDCGTIGDSLIRVDALLLGSLPSKKSETSLTIHGVRVEPPTKTIS